MSITTFIVLGWSLIGIGVVSIKCRNYQTKEERFMVRDFQPKIDPFRTPYDWSKEKED